MARLKIVNDRQMQGQGILRSVISARELAAVLLTGLFLLLLPGAGNACRLCGVIGNALPADLLHTDLITASIQRNFF
jgi:hypothetical protein